MSILMVGLSLLTMVATTYAWVGLLSNSTLDQFNINVKQATEDDADYGIEMSLTGEEGTFSDSIDLIELKKQILMNTGMYNLSNLDTENKVNEAFRRHRMVQCSAHLSSYDHNYFERFTDMNNMTTKNYFMFDLYISLYRKDGVEDLGDQNLSIYLRQVENDEGRLEIIDSDVYSTNIINKLVYPSFNPSGRNILGNGIDFGQTIYGKVSVKTSTAARIAFQKFDPQPIGQTAWSYGNLRDLKVFRTGTEFPSYNSTTGVYDLFHIGHLNLLKNAKGMCDKLIVGVTVDELVAYKGKRSMIPFEDRIELVRSCRYVDAAVPQYDMDKLTACKKLGAEFLFVGDDWYGTDKWREYEKQFSEAGIRIVYFPYTKGISSTKINEALNVVRKFDLHDVK